MWSVATPASASDEFIAGYATGILRHEFGITDASVEVRDGDVIVTTKSLATIDRGKVVSALKQVPGVSHVEIRSAESAAPPPAEDTVQTTIPTADAKWLPHGTLFAPLHADPRWPQFAGAYRQFTQGLNLSGVFAADFGETFAIYRNKAFLDGEWELGAQAGVFSIFDVSAASIDLVNADYRVGFLSSYRKGPLSGFVRIQHQSSHLGDEFLLNNPGITRINLSYEEVDVKLSYQLLSWLRLYGGGGLRGPATPRGYGTGVRQEWELNWSAHAHFSGEDSGRSPMAIFNATNARAGRSDNPSWPGCNLKRAHWRPANSIAGRVLRRPVPRRAVLHTAGLLVWRRRPPLFLISPVISLGSPLFEGPRT